MTYARGISFTPVFPSILAHLGDEGANIVPFDRVHVVLHHPDGTIALDTMVNFPPNAESISLALVVPLSDGAPGTGEDLSMNLGYVNVGGDVVFEGGPVTVNAHPYVPGAPPDPPVSIPVTYTGPGATAVSVAISPRSAFVASGDPFAFTAVALDAGGHVIPNTPIVWTSLDPTLALITSPGAGAGLALNLRGTARISAQLLTGPSDNVTVSVSLPASVIAASSGGGQTANTNQPLPQPLVAMVTASDGVPVSGVAVTFAAGAGGGSVNPATAITDANGLAQTTARLGATAGAQTFTASANGLSGSPATFAATATLAPATQLAVTTQPAPSTIAGATLAAVVVTARDANNNTAASFNGPVTISLGTNPGSATLSGTATVNAVAGIATFSTLSLNRTGTGYTLIAKNAGLTSATSNAFNIVPGAPASIVADSGDSQNGIVGTALQLAFVARVLDALGNTVPGATVTWSVAPGGGTVNPTPTITDAAGRARSTLVPGNIGAITVTASVTGVSPSATFTATGFAGPAAQLAFLVQPSNGASGAAIAPAIIVQALDAFGFVAEFNGNVTLALTTPGGASLTGTLTQTASGGSATFNNISVNRPGAGYTITATAAGLTSATSSAFTIGVGAPASIIILAGNAQTALVNTNVPVSPSVRVVDANANPVPGVAVTFTPALGSGIVLPAAPIVSNAQGIATLASWTLGATPGAQSLVASAGAANVTISATAAQIPSLTSTTAPDVDAVFAIVPFTLNGLGFISGATNVTTIGPVSITNIVVTSGTSLDANFIIPGGIGSTTLTLAASTPFGVSGSLPFNVHAVASAPAQAGAAHGGGGGTPYNLNCAGGEVATGLDVRGGSNVDAVGLICQSVTGAARAFGAPSSTGTVGGTGGSPATLSCPANYVLAGITGRIGSGGGGLNDLIAGVCTPIGGGANVITGSIGGVFGGSVAYTEMCPAGLVVTGLQGGAGNLVDRTQIVCQ